MVVKSNNKLEAEKRRETLNSKFGKITGLKTLSYQEIKNKYKFDFPSSLAVSINDSEINIAICSKDKLEAKTNYELETWAFALLSKFVNNFTTVRFYVKLHYSYEELKKEKWYNLFLKRLSFFNKYKTISTSLFLYTFDDDTISKTPHKIPDWEEKIQESSVENIYESQKLKIRLSKAMRNKEDIEQDRIISTLLKRYPNSFIQKEFPFAFEKNIAANKLSKNRIDILHTDDKFINIIEVKVKKELDVISQLLDYYIFVLLHLQYFELKSWNAIKPDKTIRSLILCTTKHPLLDSTADIYKKFGFESIEIYECNNGHYGNII